MESSGMMTRSGHPAASLWDLERGYHHLNHGSFGAVPLAVLDHQDALKRDMESNPVRWFATQADRLGPTREGIADRLGVSRSDLVMVPNASAAASTLYRALDNHGPVHVLVTDHGYGAVSMGAERLARTTGGTYRVLPIALDADDDTILAAFDAHLRAHRTDLVVIDQITSATARALPARAVIDLAHAHGTRVLVDGAHAPGVLADPVLRAADVWFGNLHKFWCAPRGSAVLVRNDPDLDLFPLVDSWGGHEPFPDRFDHQGTVDVTAWMSAAMAYDHLEAMLGWTEIRTHAARMTLLAESEVGAALRAAGVTDPVADVGTPVDPMRLFRLPGPGPWDHAGVDALRVPFMEATGCIVSFTEFRGEGFLRLSAAPYTTPEDIRALAHHAIPILADEIRRTHPERTVA